jgi:SAM-dependent methyltransferase
LGDNRSFNSAIHIKKIAGYLPIDNRKMEHIRKEKAMLLNLAAGMKQRKDAVNVDVTEYPGIDQIVDLSVFPWPWENDSIDGIYASHIIEHFFDQEKFIYECLRILKKGGFLRLNVPHSSCATSIGCMGHFRTYSYSTFRQYLSEDYYMFKTKKFKTVEQKLLWWYEEIDAQGELTKPILFILKNTAPIVNFFVRLSPHICENLWCYWVGGMKEVIWKGIKI